MVRKCLRNSFQYYASVFLDNWNDLFKKFDHLHSAADFIELHLTDTVISSWGSHLSDGDVRQRGSIFSQPMAALLPGDPIRCSNLCVLSQLATSNGILTISLVSYWVAVYQHSKFPMTLLSFPLLLTMASVGN